MAGTRPARASRSRLPLLVVLALVAAAAAVGVFVVTRAGRQATPPARRTTTTTAAATPAPVVEAVHAFDPDPGDGSENDASLRRLVDGDRSTSWSTEEYHGPRFGGLKTGVGVVLVLQANTTVQAVTVSTSTKGYGVSAFVTERPHATVAGWGRPTAERTGVDGSVVLRFAPTRGGAVLVWFTDPGPTFQLTVDEIGLQGP